MCMAAVLLPGCTKSNIVNNADGVTVEVNPNALESVETTDIDWDQAGADAKDLFLDTSEYKYAKNFYIYMQPEEKKLQLLWVVSDDLPSSLIDVYAKDLLKGFNDIIADQGYNIEHSSSTSYGGLWNEYSVTLGIIPESAAKDSDSTDEWFLDAEIPAGTQFVFPGDTQAADDGTTAAAESSTGKN